MTVFLIWNGYDDQSLSFVASTKELAQKYIDAHFQDKYRTWIDECDVDDGIEQIQAGLKMYRVSLYTNGESGISLSEDISESARFSCVGTFFKPPAVSFYVTCWATDETQAMNIAKAKRMILIASGKWPSVTDFKSKPWMEAK